MAPSGLTGEIDAQTSTAVLGFEKWVGPPPGRHPFGSDGRCDLARDPARAGAARTGHAHRGSARTAGRPAHRERPGRAGGAHLLGRLRQDSQGSFHVLRKERYSWSVPFKVWLPWASYFTGRVAFHEFGSVPTYAASHGCIRVNHYDAQILFDFATLGTAGRRLLGDVTREPSRRHHGVRRWRWPRHRRGRCCRVAAVTLVALGIPAESRADDAPPHPAAPLRRRGRPSSWSL